MDATFSVADLWAKFQACPPTKETTAKIRSVVKPGEAFPVGRPYLRLSARHRRQAARVLFFRSGHDNSLRASGDLFTQALPLYRVKMVTLVQIVFGASPLVRQAGPYARPSRPLPDLEPADLQWLDAEFGHMA